MQGGSYVSPQPSTCAAPVLSPNAQGKQAMAASSQWWGQRATPQLPNPTRVKKRALSPEQSREERFAQAQGTQQCVASPEHLRDERFVRAHVAQVVTTAIAIGAPMYNAGHADFCYQESRERFSPPLSAQPSTGATPLRLEVERLSARPPLATGVPLSHAEFARRSPSPPFRRRSSQAQDARAGDEARGGADE